MRDTHISFCTIIFLLFAIGVVPGQGNRGAPDAVNYQGWIANDQGEPHPGPQADLVFSLFLDSGGTNLVWRKTEEDVAVAEGSFNVILDQGDGSFGSIASALTSSDSTVSSDRFLGISVNGGPDIEPRHKLLAVPYAVSSGNGVPIGSIIPFWDFEGTLPVPDNFVVCDGSVVEDPESPLNGQATPDLRDRYLMGGTTNGTGGSSQTTNVTAGDLNHKHLVPIIQSTANMYPYVVGDPPLFGTGSTSVSHNKTSNPYDIRSISGPLLLSDYAHNVDLNAHSHTTNPPYARVIPIIRIK